MRRLFSSLLMVVLSLMLSLLVFDLNSIIVLKNGLLLPVRKIGLMLCLLMISRILLLILCLTLRLMSKGGDFIFISEIFAGVSAIFSLLCFVLLFADFYMKGD